MALVICDECGKHISKSPNNILKHNFCCRKHYTKYRKKHPDEFPNSSKGGNNQRKFLKRNMPNWYKLQRYTLIYIMQQSIYIT